jgi:hypothetical protein
MGNADHYTWLPVSIPFGLTIGELILDPAAHGDQLGPELAWLFENATEEEIPRIFLSAALLMSVSAGTVGECISTAIIWERG